MIKGVLIEKRKSYAIVLTEDGDFRKTGPVSDIEIGEEAIIPPIEERQSLVSVFSNLFKHPSIRISTALALIMILIFPIYSWVGQSNKAEAYVSIDINPSIELTVNKNDEVIDITGLNKDGTLLINELKWQDEPVVDLAEAIIHKSDELGYLQKDHEVMLGISYLNDEEESDLLGQMSEKINDYNDRIKVAMFTIPEHVRKQAQHKNQSMNLTYASETLTTYYEEQENNDSNDTNDSKEDDANQESKEEKTNSHSSTYNQKQKVEIMKRFLKRSNADSLPPGLMKKIQEDQSLPPGLKKKENKQDNSSTESQEDVEENETERDRHPSDKEKDHPSHKGKEHPSNKGEDHPSNKGNGHPSNKKADPPSTNKKNHSDKEEGHPSEKEDDHPSHSNGHGPPEHSGDHPSDKDDDHPSNKGQDHPSNKDDDHPSNRGKHSDKE
uniref:anti-sigma-I factor RsgI family protein n=1 Tax=uncultured Allobacillus sp. TaxID=1638025 RepID=UPI002592CDF9|nr:anti-sigma factor domain-containing protein [uncultured Allobacillus sp.]